MTKKHVKVQETEDSEIPNIQHNELMMNPDEYSLFIEYFSPSNIALQKSS